MTTIDLITQCFYALNSFKRSRALANIKRMEGKQEEAIFQELKQYQYLDNLELGLRALQKGIYDLERTKGGTTNATVGYQKSDESESD